MAIRELLKNRRFLLAILIPIIMLPIPIMISTPAGKGGYVVFIMAGYWLTEALPLAITSLIPIFMYPLFGIMSTVHTCQLYMKDFIMMFLASLIAATAVESSNLHNRLSLRILLIFGTSPVWLLLGFMLNTMFLSMWISNTATTALMVPIVDAVLVQLRHRTLSIASAGKLSIISSLDFKADQEARSYRRTSLAVPIQDPDVDAKSFITLRKTIYLGICYAANFGGLGTITGTGPNLVLYAIVSNKKEMEGIQTEISFLNWMLFNVPPMLVCTIFAWAFLIITFMRNHIRPKDSEKQNHQIIDLIKRKYLLLGKITFHETVVFVLFFMMIMLWFFRNPEYTTGWAPFLNNQENGNFIGDASPALLIVMLFYIIPSNPDDSSSPALLDWKTTQDKIPWNIVLLIGGGFALAEGSKVCGLSLWLSNQLSKLNSFSSITMNVIICSIVMIMTEVASNSVTATLLLPTVKDMAIGLGKNPLYFMIPLTVCCSYAFILPIASAPNAIVFEEGGMKVRDMAFPGLFMKVICLIIIVFSMDTWGYYIFNFTTPINMSTANNSSYFMWNQTAII